MPTGAADINAVWPTLSSLKTFAILVEDCTELSL